MAVFINLFSSTASLCIQIGIKFMYCAHKQWQVLQYQTEGTNVVLHIVINNCKCDLISVLMGYSGKFIWWLFSGKWGFMMYLISFSL